MPDNVVGAPAYAITADVKSRKSSKLRLRVAGTAPGVGESHFVFPSECFRQSYRERAFDVRGPVNVDGRESTCAKLAAEWKRSKSE